MSDSLFPELNRLTRRSLSDVKPALLAWVWQDWIARGAVSLVLGETGVGKSCLAMELAAMVTRGWNTLPSAAMRVGKTTSTTEDTGEKTRQWHTGGGKNELDAQDTGEKSGQCHVDEGKKRLATEDTEVTEIREETEKSGGMVMLFGCGDPPHVMRERLEAAGAKLNQVRMVMRNYDRDLADLNGPLEGKKIKAPTRAEKDHDMRLDLLSLEHQILQLQSEGHEVPLVIIDPVESLLRDALDKGRLADLLNALARKTGAAIVVVGLTTLASMGRCGFKISTKGIEDLFRVARTVLTLAYDLDEDHLRVVLPTKMNLSARQPGRKFEIRHPGLIEWSDDELYLTTEEYVHLLRERMKDALSGETHSELNRVTTWLQEQLQEGPVPSVQIRTDAGANEISGATLRRAFKRLGCRSNKLPITGRWAWKLPGTAPFATGRASRDGSRIDESFARCETTDSRLGAMS